MKQNKIKGGVYKGWWRDFVSATKAKKIAHKQNRRKIKSEIASLLEDI